MPIRFNTDVAAGMLFILIGSIALYATGSLPFGTLRRIGPGGFPAIISTLLILFGLITTIHGFLKIHELAIPKFHPKNVIIICLALVLFGLSLRGGGLFLAVFLCITVSSLAVKPFQLIFTIIYGLLAALFCCVAFITLLGMQAPYFGPWFGF